MALILKLYFTQKFKHAIISAPMDSISIRPVLNRILKYYFIMKLNNKHFILTIKNLSLNLAKPKYVEYEAQFTNL